MASLHPQAQEFVERLAADPPRGWHQMPLAEAREAFETFGDEPMSGEKVPLAQIHDRTIGEGIRIRVYRPSDQKQLRPIVYFHGGGWVLGSLETHDALCRFLAVESRAVVISVDYRLSPECPFPEPLDDCYEALTYVAENAEELGVDRDRIVVAGDSAGGNLALAVAIRARDEQGPRITQQLLMYPVVSPVFSTKSYSEFASGFGLTRDAMMFFWESYVGRDFADAPVLADLAKIESYAGLPSTHVVVASHDVLRDEGLALVDRLKADGVSTTCKTYAGMLHGFVHFVGLFDDGRAAIRDIGAIVKSS